MRKEAVKVTPRDIIAPGPAPAPSAGSAYAHTQGTATADAGRGTGTTQVEGPPAATASPTPAAPAVGSPAGARSPSAASQVAPADPADDEDADPGAPRRNFFRLDVFDVRVRFDLGSIDDDAGEAPKTTAVEGRLVDVSAGGLRLSARGGDSAMPDWPVRAQVLGQLQFALQTDQAGFQLPARLVRRVETTDGFQLAFTWEGAPQAETDRLVRVLYQLELRRRAGIRDDRRTKRSQPSVPPPRPAARHPGLFGGALGLATAAVVGQTLAQPALTIVLGSAAVIVAVLYLLAGA